MSEDLDEDPLGEPFDCRGLPYTEWDIMYRLTRRQYYRMIDAGVFAGNEFCELLEGVLVRKFRKSPGHSFALQCLWEWLLASLPAERWQALNQRQFTCGASEPEPDLSVVRVPADDFRSRHPDASELALVVEVCGASLFLDRGRKSCIYASAGIPEYWIVNLIDRQVEVHRQPVADEGRYAEIEIVPADGTLKLTLDGTEIGALPVAELLP